jgi:ferrous iron transport protein A
VNRESYGWGLSIYLHRKASSFFAEEESGSQPFLMKRIIKMRQMSDNQKGTVKKVSAPGEMGRRIREMGLVPETEIQVQGRAPLRDPVAIKIRDYTLTLRNNEADSILVEVEEQRQDEA